MSSDARGSSSAPSRWLAVPAPVRQLFKLFPLHAYDPEPLPWRAPDPNPSPSSPARPRLYVFLREIDTDANDDALLGRPSFNPSCLKWQTFLRIAGVDVDLVSSNNHASPSGALPFLVVPEGVATSKQQPPLTGAKIFHYARDHAARDIPSRPSHRLEAYQALLDQAIRPAWVGVSSPTAEKQKWTRKD
jgi:metaxin